MFSSSVSNYIASTLESTANKVVIGLGGGVSNYGTSVVFNVGFSTNTSFIGITDQAIADTATGEVIVQGGVNSKVTGLTIGTDYYVQANGALSTATTTVPAGRALSTSSILLEG